ncbi:MAG: transketolase [Oscillospiraceae bacterium]
MNKQELISLKNKATELRIRAVDMIWKAQSGHPGGSLSVADFVAACYFHYMNIRPEDPRWPDRDRFVLSKGHVCPAQYAALAMRGYFPLEVLDILRKEGSPLQGHPSMNRCPGIDISTGSLGQGLACAVGMALAGKMDGKDYRVFCAVGDGECNEGEIWEACGTAYKYKLDNLLVFVDWNNLQLDGTCEEIMPPISLARKFAAFGFEVYEVDGNDMEQLTQAMDSALAAKNGLPKCIVGKTVKGKGVSYMENVCAWHGTAPNDEQYRQAMNELNALYIKEES